MARIITDNPLFKKTESGDFGVIHLPIAAIQPSPHQSRRSFSDESIAELAESIKTVGLLQPIKVVSQEGNYYVVYGERRLRALKQLGVTELIWDSRTQLAVYDGPTNVDLAVQTLTENILRENLSPIEEAEAYQHMKTMKGFKKQQELADYMGIDKRRISEKLQLLELSDKIKQELINQAGKVTASHARELMKLESEELQFEVIKRISDQGLSVKDTTRLVNDLRRRRSQPDGGGISERIELRRRVEQQKFIRRFEQLCRQLLRAAEAVAETDTLKEAFRKVFANEDNVLVALEHALRSVRSEIVQQVNEQTLSTENAEDGLTAENAKERGEEKEYKEEDEENRE